MAPAKKPDVEVAMENLREEVGKIGVMESTMAELKGTVAEIRNRMGVLERLEQRLNEDDETRKREASRSRPKRIGAVSFALVGQGCDRRRWQGLGKIETTH
ncbi:hypothetical protein F2Q70_00032634 [Brassica cretica]|uniref:Uncharacterized protein n=1 Tax=Brassica cretica TaxID=69181 RepID=A0A8S9FMK0_BRACR|nr:hypothetical protein F2Q70_00032634 [Brassica cretica]